MREVVILFLHLIVTVVRLARPGGLRSVVAESLLVKHQLYVSSIAAAGVLQASTPIIHSQISVVIDGSSIVEAYTKRRLPPDFRNSPTGTGLQP